MATPSGGKPIDQGILARAGQALKDWWFGPDKPQPLSAPAGTPPRQFDYPVGYNINIQPRNLEATSFEQLRQLADSWDLLRLFIEKAKESAAAIPWEFRVKKQTGENKAAHLKRNISDKRLGKLQVFFEQPDGEHTWQEWIKMVLEEAMVIDALSIAPLANLDGTLWTSGVPAALDVIDGATIARKIDGTGRTPQGTAVAYQQIIKGIPAVDFTRDQLVYKPRNVRVHKFYGFSPVEQIKMTINIGLRREMDTLQRYTEGNVPEAIAQVPKEWSADQITEFQDWFDSKLAGNTAMQRRITFVPECGSIQFTKDPLLKDVYDEWLIRVIAYAFGLSPQQFISMMNRATAETSVEQAASEGLMPILNYVADVINFMLRKYWGFDDIEFAWQTQSQGANPLDQAKIDDIYVRSGILQIDEVRSELGKEAVDGGDRNIVITGTGVSPLDTAIENADNPPEPQPDKQLANGKDKTPPPPKPKKIWRQRPVQ
jgi:hypothetical protein